MSEFSQRARALMIDRGVSVRGLARATFYDQGHLSKVTSGRKRPSPELARVLDEHLEAGGDLAALVPDPPAKDGATVLDVDGSPATGEDVEALRSTIGHLVTLDGMYGGGEVAPLALRAFRRAQRTLADGNYLPSIERDLEAVAAELGELSGWLLFDAARWDEARAVNAEAFTLARIAGDVGMGWFVLSNQALADVHVGRNREALRIARSVETGDMPVRVRALFDVRAARALAKLGDRSAALRVFDHARSGFYEGATAADPVWAWWFDERELAGHEGEIHAALGDHTRALPRLATAVERSDGRRHLRWAAYIHRANLLRGCLRAGAHTEARRVAAEVAPMVGEVASPRTERVLVDAIPGRERRRALPTGLGDTLDHLADRLAGT